MWYSKFVCIILFHILLWLYLMFVYSCAEVVRHWCIFLLCMELLCCIYSIFTSRKRSCHGWFSSIGSGSFLKCLSVRYCLCINGETILSLNFRILSTDCMIFSLSIYVGFSFGTPSSVFCGFSNDVPFICWLLIPTFNVHITLDRDVACLLFLTLNGHRCSV